MCGSPTTGLFGVPLPLQPLPSLLKKTENSKFSVFFNAQSSGRLRRPYNPAHTFYRKVNSFPLTHKKLQKNSDNSKKNVYNYVWYFYAQFFLQQVRTIICQNNFSQGESK